MTDKTFRGQSIILEIVAQEWIVLLMSRLVSGLAGGLIGTSIMVYMSEISMPQFRGALLGSFSLSYALGQVFLAVGLKVLEETNELAFRNIFYSEFVFFGLWIIPMVFLPETPGEQASTSVPAQSKALLLSSTSESLIVRDADPNQLGTPPRASTSRPRSRCASLSATSRVTTWTTSTR